jgi:hypothetical protein
MSLSPACHLAHHNTFNTLASYDMLCVLLRCYFLQERLPELVKLRGRVVKSSRNLARYNAKYQRHVAEHSGDANSATAAAHAAPGQTGSIHTRSTGGGMR